MTKWCYFFGKAQDGRNLTEGDASMKALLGGKGANLAEMATIGLPVPPGFTITTEACKSYYDNGEKWPEGLAEQHEQYLQMLEGVTGKKLGDPHDPLLVSVRSGAAASMPGMMDTVLNLGLNDDSVKGLIEKTGNPRFGWDCYRRFIDMFGDVVAGVDHEHFEEVIHAMKEAKGVKYDTELDADDLAELCKRYKDVYRKHKGELFPQDPRKQLTLAINAVFGSWNSDRAVRYRQINQITGLLGTAVNICTMVFGNMGDDSGTGVCFTRNPSTGKKEFYGEFLMNAQGEDVVAGIRTPIPLSRMKVKDPRTYEQLEQVRQTLESHYKDMQDIEFTIERGRLFILQTRSGKRTAQAAVKIAVDMVKEGLIDERTAVTRVEPAQLDQLLHPYFDPKAKKAAKVVGKGLPASPGAAVGQIVFNAEDAEAWHKKGRKVILVRIETSPEDVGGMHVAEGILTARGGMTSHAAVVARGWGKTCVAGCDDVIIDYNKKLLKTKGGVTLKEGAWISIDGSTGEVMQGQVATVPPGITGDFKKFMTWADKIRCLKVRTNADTPADARRAREFGAQGIGLCRTEHMFFEGERIWAMREMILADNTEDRRKALVKLLPYQRKDFIGIFEAMNGLPVTIRLLDPPLHEFLPQDAAGQKEMAQRLGVSVAKVKDRVQQLHELNPMLGHRGCRLPIAYPEIGEMQTRAIIEAAIECKKRRIKVLPEIMVPLVGIKKELEVTKRQIVETAQKVMKEKKTKVEYLVGTMIEIPRAALIADQIAQDAQFFSFGTNDLTQMTFGFSRDDIGSFLPAYIAQGVLEIDPFSSLDTEGVGQLIEMGTQRGRQTRPDLKVGICGEHGGDPKSVMFCHKVGMNYVSCSPFRVPIARLAAAQAAVKYGPTAVAQAPERVSAQ
jgi:pyruvate,orthophosphate dikinase